MITVKKSAIRREIVDDGCFDASYLYQKEFEDRLRQYQRGEFIFVGVRASVALLLPMENGHGIIHHVESPGLWGIESDSTEDYFHEVFCEERDTLIWMLEQLNVKVEDDLDAEATRVRRHSHKKSDQRS